MILVIDMNWKKNSLAYEEFVTPIISAVKPIENFEVKHFSEITEPDLETCSKVLLSGTALKDHTTLKQLEKFNWTKKFDKPILGICAGMQTLSLVFDEPLIKCLQIGMSEIQTKKENPLFQGVFKAYVLHNFSVGKCRSFEILAQSSKCIQAIKHKQKDIYGVLFHPEVRNQEIIRHFVELK
jgi:anthranilate/para-aminobenzoate synthase component II